LENKSKIVHCNNDELGVLCPCLNFNNVSSAQFSQRWRNNFQSMWTVIRWVVIGPNLASCLFSWNSHPARHRVQLECCSKILRILGLNLPGRRDEWESARILNLCVLERLQSLTGAPVLIRLM